VVWTVDDAWSFVELAPRTGRTHQLRVHLSLVAGCPIAGDRRYGGPTTIALSDGSVVPVPRVLLHAATISLLHPESDASLLVEAPLWPDFGDVLERLGRAPFGP
jgi:23S rRNA-/tRNA-specific pseudouridylate synthase